MIVVAYLELEDERGVPVQSFDQETEGESLDSWLIRKPSATGSADGELRITLTRKPVDQIIGEDQMTWTKVGELVLTPTRTSPIKIKGFTIRKLLKLKHADNHEGK